MIVKEGEMDENQVLDGKLIDLRSSEKRKSGKSDHSSPLSLTAPNGKKRPSMLNENIGLNHMEGAFEGIEDKVICDSLSYFKRENIMHLKN